MKKQKQVPVSETFEPVTDNIDFSAGFTDVELLFASSSAKLYRARRSGKFVLIKTPANDSGLGLEWLKREFAMAVGMTHHNIVSLYSWEIATPVGPGIVMEYVDGSTLGDFIRQKQPLATLQRIFLELLDAVEYLHRHGLVHNDLKPANVLVTDRV